MATIHSDVTDNTALSIDDATSAFLESWKDPEEVSKDKKGAKPEDDETVIEGDIEENDEDLELDGSEEDPDDDTKDTGQEDPPKKAAKVADDDAEVTYSENGVEHKVSVKELKRLAGQEAALTRKSQEAADARKEINETRAAQVTALNTLVQRAEAAYKPYADIDYLVASKNMSTEDFSALREAAKEAHDNLQFLTQELGGVLHKQAEDEQKSFIARSQETIRILSDPETGIKGWGQPLYQEICEYAVKSGMSQAVVNKITDPTALRVLHKAMAYDKIKAVATTKKATSVKKALNSSGNSRTSETAKQSGSEKSAMATLKATGTRESAANAFLSRWAVEED